MNKNETISYRRLISLCCKVNDCFAPAAYLRLVTWVITLLLITIGSCAFAQSPYDNTVYHPEIKSVEFYNTAKKASFPIITLNSSEKLLLAFDNLLGGTVNYYYTIDHCDANWNSSNISTAEYLKNYTDDKITDYSYSSATVQKYTHYEIKLPNNNIAPKIAGNYILKVYEDGDQTKLVLTRRMYVVDAKINIAADVVPSNDNTLRQSNQKINFTLDYGSLRVQNPGADLRTFVMQNARSETSILNTQPTYIRGTQLIYSDITANDFAAGNEFRHFDTRSLKLNSDRISKIYRDTANAVVLLTDPDRSQANYTLLYDLNGSFYILNQDGTDPRTDADYSHMYFSLASKKSPAAGTPYIVGQFNDYKLDEQSKLHYDATYSKWTTNLLLKQGVFDYTYVWVDKASGKADATALEGSYFETENDYQLLVYYRPPGSRWEELIGYKLLNSVKK
ncbi:DUF5103 domain-containing protein [Mucilaginibacter sp.]|uniref:type IX secretion system plug protein n=1 Tax=Mucilaginibacter sp. TaxID=1882438 RepID=UPI003D0E999D